MWMKKGDSTSIFASWEKASTCIAIFFTWNHDKIGSRKLLCYPYTHCMFACTSIHGNELPYALLQAKRVNTEEKRIKTKGKRETAVNPLL